MDLVGAIIALVIGLALVIWTVHIVLTIIGWVFIVAGAIWLLRNLLGSRNRL